MSSELLPASYLASPIRMERTMMLLASYRVGRVGAPARPGPGRGLRTCACRLCGRGWITPSLGDHSVVVGVVRARRLEVAKLSHRVEGANRAQDGKRKK